MKRNKLVQAMLVASLILTGCGKADSNKPLDSTEVSQEKTDESASLDTAKKDTVKIKDIHGEVEVPKNPERVVSLDNRTFETLEEFGVNLVAAPKDIMPTTSSYKNNDKVENIGNHREPNLEILAAADPDFVIVGQRFSKYYEQIKELLPNATIVDFSYDVSEDAENPGKNLIEGFKESTLALGEIFDKKDKAKELVDKLDTSIKEAKEAYKGDNVMSLIVSGGDIGYAAPKTGRVWGPLYEILGLKPSLELDKASADHKGDDISVEAIAESNPHYLLVLDRDQATSDAETSTPARDVIDNAPALQNLDVIKENRIYYAPDDTYTNESIQTFTKIFEGLRDLFQSEN